MLPPPSPVKPPPTSLGSKLAAHFVPRARKLSALSSKRPPDLSTNAANLSPPDASNPRGESLDSGSSGTRSLTPRPSQPAITVSLSSENLEEYKDLFTMPKKKKSSQVDPPPRDYTAPESLPPQSSSSPSLSPLISTKPDEIARRGSAPTILDASRQKTSRNQRGESPSTKMAKPTRRASPTEKQDPPTPRNSDGKDSSRSNSFDKLLGPPIQRRQPITTSTPAADYSAQQRLRMRQQTAEKLSKPPSMPLPQTPPSPSLPASSSPTIRPASILPPSNRSNTPSRPRSNTVGSTASVANSPLSQSTLPQSPQTETTPVKVETNSLDLDSASHGELKEALATRNRQYDELVNHLSKTLDKHASEKVALEKKVSQLEREMSKKENQIKGLMWLVANNKGPPATDFPPNLALPPLPSKPEMEQEPQKYGSLTRLPTRRTQLSDDSGAESHLTSGAESLRTSETSGNESGSRIRKFRRPFVLGDSSYAFYRVSTGSKRLPPPKSSAPEGALPEVPQHGKRSSISSASLSPASSTSSLLPPSPSVTVSSLSSIPEAPSSLRYSSKPSDSSDHHEERRNIRTNRMSTSSMASSSTAASSSYATNLKRSRPPSIAQVLEHSPNLPNVLDKLRPFGP